MDTVSDEHELPAGDFSTWLEDMQGALRGDSDADVPCGGCTACCTASQFVHISPDEADSLAHIPAELLFPAPGAPDGHVLLGYDERGHCPMLEDGACSIYAHRPRTCRTYDCRVFPAADVALEGEDKALVARQARRWRFGLSTDTDRVLKQAVSAAADYLRERAGELPSGAVPRNPTQLAVLAIDVHHAFLDDGVDGRVVNRDPDVDVVRASLEQRRRVS